MSELRRGLSARQRVVTSSAHEGPCQPCALCKKGHQSKYFHPKNWKDPTLLERLQEYEPSLHITSESCLCRPCNNQVSEIGTSNFIPRWRKNVNTQIKYCCIPGCSNLDIIATTLVSIDSAREFFSQENDNACNEGYETPSDVTLLCNFHYKTWHREYKQACPTHIKCSTCGKVISDLSKSRSFPEPEILQTFLRENTDFTGELSPNDRVCYICYRSHLSIVKHCKASVKSLDLDLRELINSIQKRQCKVEEISSYDDALDYAVKFVAVTLGECLIKQTAALLPKLFEALREKLLEITHKRGINITQDLPCHAWLRSQLSFLLKQ